MASMGGLDAIRLKVPSRLVASGVAQGQLQDRSGQRIPPLRTLCLAAIQPRQLLLVQNLLREASQGPRRPASGVGRGKRRLPCPVVLSRGQRGSGEGNARQHRCRVSAEEMNPTFSSSSPPSPASAFTAEPVGSSVEEAGQEEAGSETLSAPASGRPWRDDEVVKVISGAAEVSVTAVVGTHLVQEAQRRHGLAPTAAAALGRLLMGTLLLGAKQGPGEAVQVSISGRGPIGRMTALALDSSHVKGFVLNPSCDPPLNAKGKMDVGAAVGSGVLTVVRSHPSWQQAYTGTVPIQTGEIAEDLAHYLAESEQVNTALGLGVAVGRDGGVLAAGGFLVQVLPFCSEETLQLLERNVSAMPAVSDLVQTGEDGMAIAARLLQGLDWKPVGEKLRPEYGPCGTEALRPKMLQAVVSLGEEDARNLLQEQRGKLEVRCEFCAETLYFSADEVLPALAESQQ